MRRVGLLAAAMVCVVGFCVPVVAATSAKDILDHVDDLYRGTSAHGTMTMTVQTANWQRSMTLEFWSKGEDKSLMVILAPTKEKGTATLRSGKNIWNYLPKVNRVIKVPSSMMGGSWMGSHFTNDDLVKESRMAQDYDFQVTFEGQRDGKEMVEITCIPKADAAVVWGKVIVEVKKDGLVPLRTRYFDEDKNLSRTLIFSEPKTIGGRTLPAHLRMIPQDKPAEFTEVRYDSIDFDAQLRDSLFSLSTLQR